MTQPPVFIRPDWPAPENTSAFVSTRVGGVSQPPYNDFNLGDHVGDSAARVRQNRTLLVDTLKLPDQPVWLEQLHTTVVVNAAKVSAPVKADASFTVENNIVCAVMTADCLPVFFAAEDGSEVAVAHAGWRGLANGILEATLAALATPEKAIMCWLGPAIGPAHFEVGDDVRDKFLRFHAEAGKAFTAQQHGKWLADIYQLAKLRLRAAGVDQIYGGNFCTYADNARFFSYRRDKETGRMASIIWKS